MNERRRKILKAVSAELNNARSIIDGVLDDESDAYDNLPEGIRDSDRGEKIRESVEVLENASCEIDSIIEHLDEITG